MQDLKARRHVHYLTKERAEVYVSRGMPKGTLHRLEGWEASVAQELAEELEVVP